MSTDARALLVAEGAAMQRFLSGVLREAGLRRIAVAGDGAEARRLCREGEFSIALVDLRPGDEDSLAFVRHIKGAPAHPTRRMPVLALSGSASAEAIERAREAGVDACLLKPLRLAVLEKLLARLLAGPAAAGS